MYWGTRAFLSMRCARRFSTANVSLPTRLVSLLTYTCGPTVNFGVTFAVGGLNVWYLAHLGDTMVDLVGQALRQLFRADISLGEVDCQVGINRQNMRTRSESQLEDSFAVYVKGCGADANVVHKAPERGETVFSRDPHRALLAGGRMANQLLRFMGQIPLDVLEPTIRMRLVSGSLSLQKSPTRKQVREMALNGDNSSHFTWWARQSIAYPDSRKSVDYDVQVWLLGELKMFWLEGEVCADLGIALKQTQEGPVMTAAYTNACPGYISSARLIRERV